MFNTLLSGLHLRQTGYEALRSVCMYTLKTCTFLEMFVEAVPSTLVMTLLLIRIDNSASGVEWSGVELVFGAVAKSQPMGFWGSRE